MRRRINLEVTAAGSSHLARPRLTVPASIRRDAVAGAVVGIIALPLSIALAVAVGAPPVAGLYTAAFAGATAAIFGGSRYNITGPTAALVPILSHVVLRHGIAALPMVGLLAGLMLLIMSALRFGRLVRYMPGPVIVGFTAGIALSIAFGQLNNFLAVTSTDPKLEHFHQKTWDTLRHLHTLGWTTPTIGIASLMILLAWPRLPKSGFIPAPLVAVVGMTSFAWATGVDTPTLGSHYGNIPGGLPTPSLAFFDASLIFDLLPAALSVAVLSSVESLLSAVVADGMAPSNERHDPDRELFGQGLANLVSPVMGGIPATAAIARTAAGIRSGGSSRLTGVFHAATVLCATVALGGLAGHIPLTVLAAILIVVAWNIAEVPELARLIRRAPSEDVMVLIATILITLFFDLTYAIGFGVLASAVLLIRRLVQLPAAEELLPDDTGRIQQVSPELSALIQTRRDIAFFTAQGMLSFHSVAAFEYELNERAHDPLILRMKDVHHIDASGLLTLEGVIEHRRKHGGRIILTAIQPDLHPVLQRFGILEKLGPENIFEHTRCAIATIDAPDGRTAHPKHTENTSTNPSVGARAADVTP
jgi:SulP family sulfate permease